MGHVLIPVQKLVDQIGDPFRTDKWKEGPITRDMVYTSLMIGTYDRAAWSYSSELSPSDLPVEFRYTPEWHAQRIAYLIVHGWNDPIEIDIGIPSLGYRCYPLLDGHHRVCAAVYREDEMIPANVSGALDYAFELFGVNCANPDYMVIE